MRAATPTSISSFFIPDGLLLLAAVAFLRPTGLPQWTGMLVLLYDYLLLGAAVVLAWYVGVSRVVIGTLLLILADGALRSAAGMGLASSSGRMVFNAVGFLLPLNFLALSLVHERRFVLHREAGWLTAVCLQVLFIVSLCVPMPTAARSAVAASLEYGFVDSAYGAWTRLSQPTLLAFAVAFALMSFRFAAHGSRLDRGFVWALGAIFLALHGAALEWSPTNFLATAGLILIVALYADEYRLSHYDELTGIPGREAFAQACRQLHDRYVIALIDIDELAQVNARFGESFGDRAVRAVARLSRCLRGGEAFRIESDTFAVVFSGRSLAQVEPRLEALRSSVQDTGIRIPWWRRIAASRRAGGIRLPPKFIATVSIGAAESTPLAKVESVMQRAEHALLRAKHAGRNEVRTASGAASPPASFSRN